MAKTARQQVRDLRDTAPARALLRLALRGDRVYCPCCDSSFRRFRTYKGPDRVCWVCGAMERHRSVWLHLDRHPELLREGASVLHVAPENVLRNRLRAIPDVTYHGGDLTAEFGPERIDVTDLAFPDGSIDIVVCNHVLEHVPDDRRAMAEIRRVLRPGGWALLLVPDLDGPNVLDVTDEDTTVTTPEERLRRFGQGDHARRYGWDYLARLAEAGLEPDVVNQSQEFDSEFIERCRLTKFDGGVEPLIFGRRVGT